MSLLRFFIFVVISIVLGILYKKFAARQFPERIRKIISVFSMIIFIITAIVFSIAVNIMIDTITSVNDVFSKVESYIYSHNTDNEFISKGIDLNVIYGDDSIINSSLNKLKASFPTHKELKINKEIYDAMVDYLFNELMEQISNIDNPIIAKSRMVLDFISRITDDNNHITVSSIMRYFNGEAILYVENIFMGIINKILTPFYIFITLTFLYIVIKNYELIKTKIILLKDKIKNRFQSKYGT